MADVGGSRRAIWFALTANLAIAVAKMVAAVASGSGAMLAEAVHSCADSGNQGLLLLGMQQARRAPNIEHPLGYGKALYFWSFIVALLLFSMGGLISVYEGWHKLQSPELMRVPWLVIVVLGFSTAAEAWSLRACLHSVRAARAGRSWQRWLRETRQSELLVVLGEDVAALAGLATALVAVVLTVITGDPRYDAIGTLIIGLLLILVAGWLAVQIHALLIGRSVESAQRRAIVDWLHGRPEVAEVLNLITLQLGEGWMLAIKAKMRCHGDVDTLLESINACERDLRAAFPQIQWIFFEPDHTP